MMSSSLVYRQSKALNAANSVMNSVTPSCRLKNLSASDNRAERTKDWVVPQVSAKEEQVYCYRTLGKVDCHGDPLGQEEQRRVLGDDESGDVKGFWENIWQPD